MSAKGKPGPKPRPLAERFWSKVDRTGGPESCWTWRGGVNRVSGYGQFRINPRETPGRTTHAYVHRIAFALTGGVIAPGEVVDHWKCVPSNPLCCNPAHLRAVAPDVNNIDGADRRWAWRIARAQQLPLPEHP